LKFSEREIYKLVIKDNPKIIQGFISLNNHIIDLGPEGGDVGGRILFEGTPEELIKNKESYTAQFLKMEL